MLALAICFLLAFTAASTTSFNAMFESRLDTQAQCRDLARSALSLAFARIKADPDWGTRGSAEETVEVPPAEGYGAEALGVVTFNPSQARGLGVETSVNNLRIDAAVPGEAGSVPRNSVHLVALGKSGPSRVIIDAIYHRPPFSTGAAASGKVSVKGLTLAALRDPGLYTAERGLSGVPPDQLEPASIRSLSGEPMEIGPTSDIYGDAQSSGEVHIHPSSIVRGRIQNRSDPAELPRIDIPAHIDRIDALASRPPYFEKTPIKDYRVFDSSQTVSSVELDGGLLCVRGDLTVNGPVTGTGAILVTGNLTMAQGSTLRTGDSIVCAAGGDLTLRGREASSYFFQGLLYCEGSVVCEEITLLGTIVVNGADSQNDGGLNLTNVNLVQTGTSAFLSGVAPIDSSRLSNGLAQGGGGDRAPHNDDFWLQINRRTDSFGQPLYDVRFLFEEDEDQRPNNPGSGGNNDRRKIWDKNYLLLGVTEEEMRWAVRCIASDNGRDPQRNDVNNPNVTILRGDEVRRLISPPRDFCHIDHEPFRSMFENYLSLVNQAPAERLFLDFRLSELAPDASRPRILMMRERRAENSPRS